MSLGNGSAEVHRDAFTRRTAAKISAHLALVMLSFGFSVARGASLDAADSLNPPEAVAPELAPGRMHAPRIVSLDLCSDWLLAHFAKPPHQLWLSPRAQRFKPPSTALQHPSHDGSLESILALRPDWVLVNAFNATLLRKRLQAAGLRVMITPLPLTLGALEELEAVIVNALGDGLRARYRADPQAWTSAAAPSPPSRARGRLLLLGPNGYGVGEGTLEHDLLRHAGWNNYLRRLGHVRLDLESLVLDPPDAIAWAMPSDAALAQQFAQHKVLKQVVPPQQWIRTDYWRWQCPGPWTKALVEQLQR